MVSGHQWADERQGLKKKVEEFGNVLRDYQFYQINQSLSRKEVEAITDWFGTSSYLYNMRFNPPRDEGTFKWFRSHPQYEAWFKTDSKDLLWVTASPGSWKSVLSWFLIEIELPSQRLPGDPLDPIICYFFFKDNSEQKNLNDAISALLRQILSHCPGVALSLKQHSTALPTKDL